MNKEDNIVFKNKCPCCNKTRVYKTKCGRDRANKLNLKCKSCTNSIIQGGNGNLFKNNERFCFSCKKYISTDNFYKYRNGRIHSNCINCSNKLSSSYYQKTYKFAKYKITKEFYIKLKEQQNNKCAICKNETKNFHTDHCHNTGAVRGLLCSKCNKALGLLNDNVEILKEAIKYLINNEKRATDS